MILGNKTKSKYASQATFYLGLKNVRYLLCLSLVIFSQKTFSQIAFKFPPNSIGGMLSVDSNHVVVNGTAFIVGGKNLVITSDHVLFQKFGNLFSSTSGKIHQVTTIYTSDKYDFAVSRFNDSTNYGHWDFGDFKKLRPGDSVIYIGWNNEIKSYKVDLAIISAIGTYNNGGTMVDFLEFEGYGIPGYSGGPVIDRTGKVVAIMREAWTKKGLKGGPTILINRAFSIEPIKIIEESVIRYKL